MVESDRLCSNPRRSVSASDRPDRGRQLVPAQRRQLIADLIRDSGSVSVADLETRFGISPMTARRDLQLLAQEGRAHRTHGGAVAARLARDEDAFANRLAEAADAKARLRAPPPAPLRGGGGGVRGRPHAPPRTA